MNMFSSSDSDSDTPENTQQTKTESAVIPAVAFNKRYLDHFENEFERKEYDRLVGLVKAGKIDRKILDQNEIDSESEESDEDEDEDEDHRSHLLQTLAYIRTGKGQKNDVVWKPDESQGSESDSSFSTGSSDDAEEDSSRLKRIKKNSHNVTYNEWASKKLAAGEILGESESEDDIPSDDDSVFHSKKAVILQPEIPSDSDGDDDFFRPNETENENEKPNHSSHSQTENQLENQTEARPDTDLLNVAESAFDTSTAEGRFLRDYLLHKGWKNTITVPEDPNSGTSHTLKTDLSTEEQIEADVAEVDEMDNFDSKVHEERLLYHFQEQDGDLIQTFPRKIESSMRETNSGKAARRKRQREAKKAAQAAEYQRSLLAARRLHKLEQRKKRKMAARIQAEIGSKMTDDNPETVLKSDQNETRNETEDSVLNSKAEKLLSNINEEWDEKKFNAQMSAMFNDDYYNEEIDEDDEESAIQKVKSTNYSSEEETEEKSGSGSGKKKKKSKQNDPFFVPPLPAGSMHFQYINVEPNDFGLDFEDIMATDDKKLKQYLPIKMMNPYRPKTKFRPQRKHKKLLKKFRKERKNFQG